jgi:predicted amidohydrolase YtcJ
MDATNRVVEALLVEGDRIAAVGSEAELRDRAGRKRRIVDLQGRALLPGFIDAHAHFPGAGIFAVLLDLNSPPIGDIECIDGIVERLRERAASTSRGDWIVGMGYDDTLLDEKRHPTRVDLDRASTQHPIAIWHISGHLAVVNSAALERVGIDAETPGAEGGRIRRDPRTGEPNGVLEENDTHVLQPLLAPGLRDSWRIVREATRRYLAAGVTTTQNGFATAQ